MPTLKEQYGDFPVKTPTLREQYGSFATPQQQVDTGVPTNLPQGTVREDFLPALEFPPEAPINQLAQTPTLKEQYGDFSQPQLDIPTPPREFGGQILLPRPQQQQQPDAFFDGVDVGTPPIQAVQPTAEELNRPSELTRRALESIDETFGVAKSPLSDPNAPLTPNQQKFEQQSEIGKLASTAGRTLARGATGVATFIPNVIEKLITGETEHELSEKGKPVGDLQAFINTLPVGKQINVVVEELKGIAQLVGDVPAQLDYALMRAIGQSDPSKGINPDNPLVKAYEGITGKPFEEYYRDAVNSLYEAPESLAFGVTIGKGIFKGLKKGVGLQPETVAEQAKKTTPTFEAEKRVVKLEPEAKGIQEVEVPTKAVLVETKKPVIEPKTKVPLKKAGIPEKVSPPQKPPKVVEPVKPKVAPIIKPKPTVKEVKAPIKKDVVSLQKKANIETIKKFNLKELDPVKRKRAEKSFEEARVKKLDESALNLADELQKAPRPISDAEYAGMTMKKFELEESHRASLETIEKLTDKGDLGAAAHERARSEAIIEQIDNLVRGSDLGGTESARSLQIRNIGIDVKTHDVTSVIRRAKASKQKPLSDAETAKFTKQGKRDAVLNKEIDRLTKQHEENVSRIEQLEAERFTKRESGKAKLKAKTATAKKKIAESRAKDLKELNSMGFRISAGVDPRASFLIGKIAVSYMKEGALSLKEVVQKVLIDLPELTESDVWRAINSKDPKRQFKQKRKANRQIQQLKSQAKLLVEIDNIIEGVTTQAKKPAVVAKEISTLRNVIAETKRVLRKKAIKKPSEANKIKKSLQKIERLQEQLDKNFREIKKGKQPSSTTLEANKNIIKNIREQMRQFDIKETLKEQLRNAEKGIFEKPKGKAPTVPEIQELRKKLRVLRREAFKSGIEKKRLEKALETLDLVQEQLDNQSRLIKEKRSVTPKAIADVRQKIKEIQRTMKVEDDIANLNEQLSTGEFEVKFPKPKVEKPVDLQRKEVELIRLRKKVRQEINDLEPLTIGKIATEAANTVRTLKATLDISGVGRQGAILATRNPKIGAKALSKSVQAAVSAYKAELIDKNMREAPTHFLRERAGLQLTEIGGKAKFGEEQFMSNLAEKIPAYGELVKASDRNMVTVLNTLRAETFDKFIRDFPNATDLEMRLMADFINKASGRGDLGSFTQAANKLSLGFFAPRFAVSRIQTPLSILKDFKQPRIRKEKAKALAAFGATGMTVLALAKLRGADVGDDPRSSDFGKIRVGNSRFDIWAGIQQPMRLLTRIGTAVTDKAGLTGKDLTDIEKEFDPLAELGRFIGYKTSPAVTIPLEFLKGETIVGEETTPSETAIRAITPIIIESIAEAYKQEGLGSALRVGAAEFVGIGASTFPDSFRATRKKIRKAQLEGDLVEASRLKSDWNINHPFQRINEVKSVDRSNFDSRLKKAEQAVELGKADKAKEMLSKLKSEFPQFKADILTIGQIQRKIEKKLLRREKAEAKR